MSTKEEETILDKEYFGKLLVLLRQKKNLSQKQLAETLNINASSVCKWEKGQNLPDIELVGKIAELFQVSCDELYHPEETYKRLTNTDLKSDSPIATTARFEKAIPIILISCFLFAVILCMCIYQFFHLHMKQFRQEFAIDQMLGEVYEISFLSHEEENDETIEKCADKIREQWVNNKLPISKDDTIKLSFYVGNPVSYKKQNPYCSMYLLFYEEEKNP